MFRISILSLLLAALLIACGSGGGESSTIADPVVAPPVVAIPLAPPVDAQVIGMPGELVNGMDAYHVTTLLGWLAPNDEVIFEGVVQWRRDGTLACGIFRHAANGRVNPLLLQGQRIPDTGGGTVIHPKLPLEVQGDTLVMVSDVKDGTVDHVLLAIPLQGGTPIVLASSGTGTFSGTFRGAAMAADGTVLAELESDEGTSLLRIPASGKAAEVLCTDCAPGIATNGDTAVVRRDDGVWAYSAIGSADGTPRLVLGANTEVPGSLGNATGVLGAWIAETGEIIVHVQTDDPAVPDVLLRESNGAFDVIARCGAPLPGSPALVDRIEVATGHSPDVVFAAKLQGAGVGIYCARPGEPAELIVRSVAQLALNERAVVADGAEVAFGAMQFESGLATAEAVYAAGSLDALLATGMRVPNARDATIRSFPYSLREGIDIATDGRVLVHTGLVETRRPTATLGALLVVR